MKILIAVIAGLVVATTVYAGASIEIPFPCDKDTLIAAYAEEGLNMRPYDRKTNPDSDGFIEDKGGKYYVHYNGIPDFEKDLRIQMKVLRGEYTT